MHSHYYDIVGIWWNYQHSQTIDIDTIKLKYLVKAMIFTSVWMFVPYIRVYCIILETTLLTIQQYNSLFKHTKPRDTNTTYTEDFPDHYSKFWNKKLSLYLNYLYSKFPFRLFDDGFDMDVVPQEAAYCLRQFTIYQETTVTTLCAFHREELSKILIFFVEVFLLSCS